MKSGPKALHASAAVSGFAPIWVNTDLQPVGQPIAVGLAMVAVVDNHGLFLVGLDPATGTELWQQPVTSGGAAGGITFVFTRVSDDKVGYFRPFPGDSAYVQVVVADARTGRDVATSPPVMVTSMLHVCVNGKDVCTISHGIEGGREHHYRLDVAADEYISDSDGLPPGARLLEIGLIDLRDRPGNTLAWLRKGHLQWRTPISAAFPPGFSSDNGWAWYRFDDQHVIVGSVFGEPQASGARFVRDLGKTAATAGLSEDTGEVLWRDSGSSFNCNLKNKNGYPVRCRWRGVFARLRGGRPSFEGLDVTVEGFEPATGKTTWSVPMGPAENLANYEAAVAIAGPTQVALRSPTGPIVLDYATGSVTTPAPGATFWCLTTTREGGQLAAVCDGEGRPSDALPSAAATIAAGARAGDHTVIAGKRGFVGFKLR